MTLIKQLIARYNPGINRIDVSCVRANVIMQEHYRQICPSTAEEGALTARLHSLKPLAGS